MKKLFAMTVIVLSLVCIFTSCDMLPLPQEKEDVITVEDGYLVVNGVKTEYKVDEGKEPENKEDVITIDEDGYLVVNGEKTEYKVHNKDEITVSDDGYVIVNGIKTQYKIHTTDEIYVNADGYVVVNGVVTSIVADKGDVITIDEDGYLVVNGVKTKYEVKNKNHTFSEWKLYNENETDCEKKLYYRVCAGCSTLEWKEGKYEDHSWNVVTTYPTCQAEGYDTKTCRNCGKVEVCNETPIADHDYSNEYTTDNSYHWHKCKNCDAINQKIEHTLGDDGACTLCCAQIGDTEGILYDISADGTYALVIGYEGAATRIKIAETYKGLPVKEIYKKAFYQNKSITSIIIPDSITHIDSQTFYLCSNLSSVKIGNRVTSIGDYAFYNCDSLTEIIIPNSVISIGDYVFLYCQRLTSVTIGDNVKNIGNSAFDGCGIISITIPDSVEFIGNAAFGAYSTGSQSSLQQVILGKGVKKIGSYAFYNCRMLTSINIPDGVTYIGECAFSGCNSLTNITLPDNITYIGSYAFSNCNATLYTEYKYGKYVRSADNPYAILVEITNKNLSTYEIHEETIAILADTFNGCSRLASITIPKNVIFIGAGAFWNCSLLTNAEFKDVNGWSVTHISISTEVNAIAPSDLENATIAAQYLSYTYDYYKYWSKK